MDILILGGAGQVGTELRAFSWPEGVRVHAPSRQSLDITDEATVVLAASPHAMIINPTAYPTSARRPANSRLSFQSMSEVFGLVPRPWQAALDDILDRLVGPVRSH